MSEAVGAKEHGAEAVHTRALAFTLYALVFCTGAAALAIRAFPVASVEPFDSKRAGVDSVQASNIHVYSFGIGARNVKWRHAADRAKMMLRDSRVERVGRQRIGGSEQAEALARHHPVQVSLLRAD